MPSTQNETSLRRRDEWVITKQACRDEGIVSLFFFSIAVYIALYSYVSSTVKQKNQYTDFLYIYIYIYIYHTSNASLSWHTVYLKHIYNFTNSAFVMPSTQNETSLRRAHMFWWCFRQLSNFSIYLHFPQTHSQHSLFMTNGVCRSRAFKLQLKLIRTSPATDLPPVPFN